MEGTARHVLHVACKGMLLLFLILTSFEKNGNELLQFRVFIVRKKLLTSKAP